MQIRYSDRCNYYRDLRSLASNGEVAKLFAKHFKLAEHVSVPKCMTVTCHTETLYDTFSARIARRQSLAWARAHPTAYRNSLKQVSLHRCCSTLFGKLIQMSK